MNGVQEVIKAAAPELRALLTTAAKLDTEAWLKKSLPKAHTLPPASVMAAQMVDLRDSVLELLKAQERRYIAHVREHPPTLSAIGKGALDNLPPETALTHHGWLEDVIADGVDADKQALSATLDESLREAIGTGGVAARKPAGGLSPGLSTLSQTEAGGLLRQIRALKASSDPGARATYEAVAERARDRAVRAVVLRDGAGRPLGAATYTSLGDTIEVRLLGTLDAAVPGTGVQMIREMAGIASAAGKSLTLSAPPESAAVYEALGFARKPGGRYILNAGATSALAQAAPIAGPAWTQQVGLFASGLTRGATFLGKMTWDLAVAGASEWLAKDVIAGVVDEVTATTHQALVDALGEGLSRGEGTDALIARIRNLDSTTFGLARAERIARTEVITANRMGGLTIATDAGAQNKKWLSRLMPNTRAWHRAAHGQVVSVKDAFSVANGKGDTEKLLVPGDRSLGASADNVINCFVGDTPVAVWGIQRSYKRWYEGTLVAIQTTLGHKLTGTPNHPVLTSRGWIALGLLQEGDHLVCCRLGEVGVIPGQPNVQDMPATFEQFHCALEVVGICERTGVGLVDFHGDGTDGEVDIVSATGPLGNRRKPPSYEHSLKVGFAPAHHDTSQEVGSSPGKHSAHLVLGSIGREGSSHTSCRSLSTPALIPHLIQPETSALGPAAGFNSSAEQDASDKLTIPAEMSRHGFFRHASAVQLDHLIRDIGAQMESGQRICRAVGSTDYPAASKGVAESGGLEPEGSSGLDNAGALLVELVRVVNVSRRENFAGHVYNLQTRGGWYVADGIITHNCACGVAYLKLGVTEDATRPDQHGLADVEGAPGPVVAGVDGSQAVPIQKRDDALEDLREFVEKNQGWVAGPDAHWARTDGAPKIDLAPFHGAVKAAGSPGAWAQSVWGDAGVGPMEPGDRAASLSGYKGGLHQSINDELRGTRPVAVGTPTDPKTRRDIDNITAAIDDAPRVPFDIQVERCSVYTGILGTWPLPDDRGLDRLVGTTLHDNGFVSTSLKPGGVGRQLFSLKIAVPAGSKAIWMEDAQEAAIYKFGENELLLQRGSDFLVTGWEKTPEGYVYINVTLTGQRQ